MKVLKSILKDSLLYYSRFEKDLQRKLGKLPRGSVKRRKIKNHVYYYLQVREGKRVVHRYVGRVEPKELVERIKRRRFLESELRKVRAALRLLPVRKILS